MKTRMGIGKNDGCENSVGVGEWCFLGRTWGLIKGNGLSVDGRNKQSLVQIFLQNFPQNSKPLPQVRFAPFPKTYNSHKVNYLPTLT